MTKQVKRIAPKTSKEMLCPNCGFNHEARDFIRSILLNLIDRLEINGEFVDLLKDHGLLTKDAHTRSLQSIEEKSKEITKPATIHEELQPKHPSAERVPSTIILRILCIQKDIVSEMVPFLAIDKDGRIFQGSVDRSLVRDEIQSDTMIKCVTNHLIDDEEMGVFSVDILVNDSMEKIDNDPAFLRVSDLETKIEDIDISTITPSAVNESISLCIVASN